MNYELRITDYGLTIIAGAVVTGTVVIVATAGVDAGSNTGVVVVVETTVAGFDRVTVAPEPVCNVTGVVVLTFDVDTTVVLGSVVLGAVVTTGAVVVTTGVEVEVETVR